MKILLDEDVPHALRVALLPEHDASTVAYVGWAGLKNGALLRATEEAQFDVFVTADKKMESQQNVTGFRLAIVVLPSQDWPMLRNHIVEIKNALVTAGLAASNAFCFHRAG